jgi:hypothetical protein
VFLCTCSNVAYDAAARRLSFSSVHIGCLALLHDTSAHLPYDSWAMRPSGGQGGSTAIIDLQVSAQYVCCLPGVVWVLRGCTGCTPVHQLEQLMPWPKPSCPLL